ncbi:hypothetical protein DKT77_20265 [Meridianimarinicoccus roseus]|uniref:AB hydrolase-1 domain-containing protein n=1 Tax=Meridianimarinicoccus roseus TaxID=2072018 RepID=A0A2V2LG08_9RHOB|nr:alpha/beta fold hydrolase [Meridianimarinicoccus roseus]PWR00863.1 hypothetical protein DKT77_20265 [Meridianimarinicoccus roseus]
MSDRRSESPAVSRIPPGTQADIDAHQGWALVCHDPAGGPDVSPGRGGAPLDLLFVHGMAAGGWIWPAAWLDGFTRQGHRCWTLTLPGRAGGRSVTRDPSVLERAIGHALNTGDLDGASAMLVRALPGASLFDGPTLDDFADAVQQAMARIGHPVVVVGHSLGGAVAQLLLRRGVAQAGTVLLASVPPYGTWRASAEMAVTNPALWHALSQFALHGAARADMALMRRALFPNGISDRDFEALMAGMHDESLAATVRTAGLPPFAPLPGPRGDVLVVGGGADLLVPPADAWMTAAYYGGAPLMVPRAGHMIMHDPHADAAVTGILRWCAARAGRGARAA